MAYADQEMSGNKLVTVVIVAVIHVVVGYALVTGLAYDAVKKAVEKIETFDVEEPEEPEEEPPPPPPEPEQVTPPPIVAPPPPISLPRPSPPVQTQQTIPDRFVPVPVAVPPPPAPPPPPSQARGASPRNQGRWAARIQQNYPSRAAREEREGRVGVSCTINADGRATNCSVSNSSGHSDLDSAATRDVERYARFNPALNAAGNPTSDRWSTTIVYRLN